MSGLAVADGEWRPLDPRVIALDRLVGAFNVAIAAGVLFFILFVVILTPRVPGWVTLAAALAWGAVVLGLACRAYIWPPVAYRHASYRVDGTGIEIRRGVIWRRAITVPRSRVQHTDVAQGPLERSYDLGTLVIHTAGTDFARVQVRGLAYQTASHIRDHLLPDEGGDAV